MKRVPAPEQRIHLGANGRIDDRGLSFVINPFDAIALQEGLRIHKRSQRTVKILSGLDRRRSGHAVVDMMAGILATPMNFQPGGDVVQNRRHVFAGAILLAFTAIAGG